MSKPSKFVDRVVTKQAEDVLVGDRLYRKKGQHCTIIKAQSNGLYAGFMWEENGQEKAKILLASAEVEIVLPNH